MYGILHCSFIARFAKIPRNLLEAFKQLGTVLLDNSEFPFQDGYLRSQLGDLQ